MVTNVASVINVKDYGATGDGTTDDKADIQAAIDAVPTNGGRVYFPAGTYIVSGVLTVTTANTTLLGEGAGSDHVNESGATRIKGSSTSGAVIRIQDQGCSIKDLTVTATDARDAASSSSNYGIWVEGEDTSTATVARTVIERVHVTRQPNHGILFVGNTVNSSIFFTDVDNCGGNGIMFDSGLETSRTNYKRPGQVDLFNIRCSRNQGHSVKVGTQVTTGDDALHRPYRINISNLECFYNRLDTSYDAYDLYLYGENITVKNSATGGEEGSEDSASTHAGIYIVGRNIKVSNHRFVDCEPHAVKVDNKSASDELGIDTRNIEISSFYINNENEGADYYNPAITVDPDCVGVNILSNSFNSDGDVDSLASTSSINFYEHYLDRIYFNGTVTSTFKSTRGALTLVDDQAAYYEFSGDTLASIVHDSDNVTRGIMMLSSGKSTHGAAVVHFRCGDSDAFATVMSDDGGYAFNTGTGQLTTDSSSGTDARINVFADTATNRLYIKNRGGGDRSFNVQFSACDSSLKTYVKL